MHKILLDQAMELTQTQGECWIVLKDGSIKAIHVGNMLPKGVLLVSPSDVELTQPASENAEHNAENHVPGDIIIPNDSEMGPAIAQELAAIQQAIQNGQDPAELAEATASGGAISTGNTAGGVAGSGNAGTIVTERSAKATISEAGFDTAHNSRDPQHQDPLPGDEVAGKIEHPPVAFDQTHVISEDTPTLFAHVPAALDLDSDGIPPLGYTLVSGVQSGQLTLNADGSYQYIPAPEFQSLKEGETRQISFTYIATDPSGNPSAPATVTITITGTNDTATIVVATPGADQGAVKEDETLSTGGKLVTTDIDNGEATFRPQTQVKGAHGTFTIDKDGDWTYELDNNDPLVQALKEGEPLPSETFTVNSADGSAQHTVTVAITGANDTATIRVATPGADQGAVKEDETLSTGGKLVATDIDNGEAVFEPQTQVKGAHGTFTIDKDGDWTYELDNNDPRVQALKEGEPLPSETFTVKSADGSAKHTVTVAITGTNDTATIGVATPGADQGAVKEDVTLTTGGKLVATDIDNSEAVFEPLTQVKGTHGTFTIDKDGDWTYELNNNDPRVQALKEGESLPSETFTVNSADGSAKHTVTVAITGNNDTATIRVATPGADQGAVKEDVTLSTGGKLVTTDIDNGEATFQPRTQVKGAHGTFTIDKDGDWTYNLDNKDPLVQALKEGESLPSETFTVNSADGTAEHNITVAITGTNDAPEFISNGDTPQGTDLDGKPTVDHAQFNAPNLMSGVMVGKVTAIDPEAGDQLTYSLTEGQGDKFEINAKTGEIWLKEGVKLAHDEQAQHQFKVKVSDGYASDEMDVTVNVIENRVPVSHAVHGFADVEMEPINKVTIIFDVSNSMTRTFDGTSTVRNQNQPTEVLAPRYESRAYQSAEALHEMIGKMIAEGGQSNTYIRLVTFSSDAQKQGWYPLDEIYDLSRPPELNGRALTDSSYLSEVNSYIRNWCNIDSGIYTDYALAQETVMLADNDSRLTFPWQEAMAEGKTGMDYWNTLQKEQPVSSVNTIFFITDGEPNPKPGSVPAADLDQRWDDYVTAQNAKVYSIGIAVDGNPKVDEALHKIGDEVVYVNSGGNLSNYLNHFAPKPIGGDLLAGSTDADGDALTVALAADRFSLLGADLHDVKIKGPLVTDSRLAEDGKLNLTTAFGVLAVASNGSYSFTQSDDSPLLDGQQVDLHFQFQVEDGRGGISDNVFTLTLNGGSVDQDRPVEVNTHTQAGDEQDNILTGTDQADVLLGQSGNDTLHGGDGNDILLGGSGSDHLYGNLGNDILTGDTGNDSLTGGLGNDILIGGRGADTFIWGRSDMTAGVETTDVIRDFSVTEHDSLDLADILSPQADHNSIDSLLHYLQVEAKSDGVTIHVATEVADQFDLHIDLQGVQMAELSTHSTQNQILDDLIQANIIHV